MTETATILRKYVEREGIISFARFMELALYCPKIGYYERDGGAVGRAGDFYTSVSTGPLFGELLAFQFSRWFDQFSARPLQLVEAGAHDGRLAADSLGWLRQKRPNLLDVLQYWIIEPSARRQAWQRERLESFAGRVTWFASLDQLPAADVNGVIFSNELLDAFPVHRLGWDAAVGRWFEWGVTVQGEQFVWQKIPQSNETWSKAFAEAGITLSSELLAVLPDGFTVEICPAAGQWWRQAATRLRRGKLLTLDYGLSAQDFFTPERGHGTLRAYRRHHLGDPLADPGDQDLTAHINFTQLQLAGEAAGLTTESFSTQAQFLTAIAKQIWQDQSAFGEWTPALACQFQMLTHPEHLGRSFRVLVQSRQ